MKIAILSLFALGLAAAAAMRYPKPPKSNTVDDYHGTRIADPYRGLENPDSPPTRAWIEAENRLTRSFFAGVPERGRIRALLEGLWNYERTSPPFREGSRYFFTRNSGLQNQSALFFQDSAREGSRRSCSIRTPSPPEERFRWRATRFPTTGSSSRTGLPPQAPTGTSGRSGTSSRAGTPPTS